jgi:hypothetical protein
MWFLYRCQHFGSSSCEYYIWHCPKVVIRERVFQIYNNFRLKRLNIIYPFALGTGHYLSPGGRQKGRGGHEKIGN